MSVAVVVKVHDGLVLAADSAATVLFGPLGAKVYDSACKITNLYRGLPIAVISTGLGSIGVRSMAILMKDLRAILTGSAEHPTLCRLDPSTYSVEGVARSLKVFVAEELSRNSAPPGEQGDIAFMVAGLSAGSSDPEVWDLRVAGTEPPEPTECTSMPAVECRGVPEWVGRLFQGVSPSAPRVLENLGLSQAEAQRLTDGLRRELSAPFLHPAMPIMDAIELGRFLVDVSVQCQRLMPGAQIVGGPVEVAALTKHEGFRWVQRKHYYDRTLNPWEVHDGRADDRRLRHSDLRDGRES